LLNFLFAKFFDKIPAELSLVSFLPFITSNTLRAAVVMPEVGYLTYRPADVMTVLKFGEWEYPAASIAITDKVITATTQPDVKCEDGIKCLFYFHEGSFLS
jgi:hypothetical protein